jgi:hypothetical protein
MAQVKGWGKNARIHLTRAAVEDLRWWASFGVTTGMEGRAVWREPATAILFTDASTEGWGGRLNPHPTALQGAASLVSAGVGRAAATPTADTTPDPEVWATWAPRPTGVYSPREVTVEVPSKVEEMVPARGFFTGTDYDRHITWKELRALRLSLLSYTPQLKGRRVHAYQDNQSAASILRSGSSRSADLLEETREIYRLLVEHDITLTMSYVRTLHQAADGDSRHLDPEDWSLNPSIVQAACKKWGLRTLDPFAASHNAVCSRFRSETLCPGSEGVDGRACQWRGERLWLCPPWHMMGEVVDQLRRTGAEAIVVAPVWDQPWYPDLVEMADDWEMLGGVGDLFRDHPGRRPITPLRNLAWKVALFHLPERRERREG